MCLVQVGKMHYRSSVYPARENNAADGHPIHCLGGRQNISPKRPKTFCSLLQNPGSLLAESPLGRLRQHQHLPPSQRKSRGKRPPREPSTLFQGERRSECCRLPFDPGSRVIGFRAERRTLYKPRDARCQHPDQRASAGLHTRAWPVVFGCAWTCKG